MDKAKDNKTKQSTADSSQSPFQRIVVIFAVAVCAYAINSWIFSTSSSDPVTKACSGYTASNVITTPTGLTADLQIAGPKCNVFGADIDRLKLLVNYDSGMPASLQHQLYS